MPELISWAAKRGALKRPKVEIPAGSYKMPGCWYARTSVVVLCSILSQVASTNKGWNLAAKLALPCMRDIYLIMFECSSTHPESCQPWVSMAMGFPETLRFRSGWHATVRNVSEAQCCPSHDTRQDGTVSQILCSELCHPNSVTTSWPKGDHLAAQVTSTRMPIESLYIYI